MLHNSSGKIILYHFGDQMIRPEEIFSISDIGYEDNFTYKVYITSKGGANITCTLEMTSEEREQYFKKNHDAEVFNKRVQKEYNELIQSLD